MANSRFELGSTVKVRVDVKTPKTATPPNILIDPTTLTLTIRRPDKTTETRVYGVGDIERTDVGKYVAPISLTQEGTYHWRFVADNGPEQIGVRSGSFDSYRDQNF